MATLFLNKHSSDLKKNKQILSIFSSLRIFLIAFISFQIKFNPFMTEAVII